jgi:hypothetical protein
VRLFPLFGLVGRVPPAAHGHTVFNFQRKIIC